MKKQWKLVTLFAIVPVVLAIVLFQMFSGQGSVPGMSTHESMTETGHEFMIGDEQENKPISVTSDGIDLKFAAQPMIHQYELATVKMNITDANSNARLSHVDWAIVVKDPQGNVFYKTTTAHSHVGMMDFKVAFPVAGNNTVSVTTSSIGTAMMGLEPTPKGRTHTMISGSLQGFKTDPLNNFGARTFEFPVYVETQNNMSPLENTSGNQNVQTSTIDSVHTIAGENNGTSVNVQVQSQSNIVAGKPSTFIITLTKSSDNSMITHPDLQLTAQMSNYTISQSAALQGNPTINGAIHGHTGVMTWSPTFPTGGKYTISIDLTPSTLSNYDWGYATTKFDVFVSQSNDASAETTQEQPVNTVSILGLESPFFTPNVLNVKTGTTVTFVNTDATGHTVTSVKPGTTDPDGIFDSGLLTAKKNTFSFKFDKPGTYEYICSVHTHMHGTIIVS
ncbi:putative blue (Type 1) copper domain protein [Nitrosotalea sinensis]|uniref:Putative blue (Type 1) copper domain protein n=1 Tax=Nitrosotalea sinensis TaxID=1499975 RepID=A0A2H1EHU8_9ARCH|nr:plastocyanin/azurin family copper-binding protein [Candidatus Nitrosotalea sinensis]SHO45619.1 putative blue (Type 1) copper domain protein [Candidatus Nitrosotalea sinensis]